jgi:hypothetical protein
MTLMFCDMAILGIDIYSYLWYIGIVETDTDTGAPTMIDLKANIETIAAEESITPIEAITLLQAAAAAVNDESMLDALCEIKWDYITI